MPTILTNGIQLPDKGSIDWYSSMQSNYNLIDAHLGNTAVHVTTEDKANWDSKQGSLSQAQLDAIAQVATNTDDIATLQSDKANASHTHSSTDITDIDDYATKDYVDTSISGLVDSAPNALDTLNELAAALNDDANFASTVTTALGNKANSADLATVATSGSYNDLSNKPTINDSTITIQKNGSTVDTFTTNGSAKTINIPVPTKTSDITNDSNFVVSSSLANVATSGNYDDLTDLPAYGIIRFCSSAISDNSSVAFSAISSTNKIKVGDFLLDTAGKMYQISSVDTANETVSVTTPLTQLAQDSDVVHKTGDETVSGIKSFSDDTFVKSLNFTNNVASPSSSASSTMPIINTITYTSGDSSVVARLNFRVTADGTKSFYPHDNNQYSLGLQSRKWSEVHSVTYYYGSSDVEFSTKFVTTDTAQTIGGVKTFSDIPIFTNFDGIRFRCAHNSSAYITFRNSNQANPGSIILSANDGNVDTTIHLVDKTLIPYNTNDMGLGTTSKKWNSFNGLNPGALSLPDLNNGIDISGYITDLTGTVENTYTPPVNGWVCVRVIGNGASIRQGDLAVTNTYVTSVSGDKWSESALPVSGNTQVFIRCRGGSAILSAKFYPCQGNV